MYAKHPILAKEFAAATTSIKALPNRLKNSKSSKGDLHGKKSS
jgi:hypothetical protein